MKYDTAQSSINASSNDITTITKHTSYTDDNTLNLSCTITSNKNKPKKKIFADSPCLKRSQSHKRHHFKVDIRNIVNEEWNEDDSENNINSINYNQICSDIDKSLNITESESELNSLNNYNHININNTWEEKSVVEYKIWSPEIQAVTYNLIGECKDYCYNSGVCLNKWLFEFENFMDSDEYNEFNKINNSVSSNKSWNEIEDFDWNKSEYDENGAVTPVNFEESCTSNNNGIKTRIRRLHISCKSSPFYSNNESNSKESNSNISNDKIKNIPTILGRILKEEAMTRDEY